MSRTSLARLAAADASVFAGFLASIGRDPSRWRWPESTRDYLEHRVADLAAGLVADAATFPEVA